MIVMTTSKDRLIEFLSFLELGQNAFEKKVGIANGYISKLKSSIGSGHIGKISTAYPELNTTWLLTGEGEMIKDGQQTTKQETTLDLSKLISTIESQQETINRQSKIIEMLTGKI